MNRKYQENVLKMSTDLLKDAFKGPSSLTCLSGHALTFSSSVSHFQCSLCQQNFYEPHQSCRLCGFFLCQECSSLQSGGSDKVEDKKPARHQSGGDGGDYGGKQTQNNREHRGFDDFPKHEVDREPTRRWGGGDDFGDKKPINNGRGGGDKNDKPPYRGGGGGNNGYRGHHGNGGNGDRKPFRGSGGGGGGDSSDDEDDDRGKRNHGGGDNYSHKYNKLKYKMTVTGLTKSYRQGDDVRAFLAHMEFLIDYYGYSNKSARMFIYNKIEDNGLKIAVSNIMREHASASIPELMTALQIGLGAKSRAIIIAESMQMMRKHLETVQGFSLRVQDIQSRKYMADPNGKYWMESETNMIETLNIFYRGLRSPVFVEECLKADVKTLQDAVCVITNYTAMKIRLGHCKTDKEIPFSTDRELYTQPQNGKFYVNAIFKAGDLDMDGNMAVERESEDINAINGPNGPNQLQCYGCGGNRMHLSTEGLCPARHKVCYNCGATGHFSSRCRKPASKATPAQVRHGEKVKRQKQLESRKINNIEEDDEEPTIGGMGDSSDEEGFSAEDVIFALKSFKKQRKAKKLHVNMISSYEVHALSHLPFVHIAIGKGHQQRKVKALIDCGSSVTLINDSLLKSLKVPYKRKPFGGQVSSFSGNAVGTDGKAELDLTIGSKMISYDFIICTGNTPYDLVLGIDFQREQNLSIINTSDGTHFLHHGEKVDCKALSDPVAAVDTVSSIEDSMTKCSIQSQNNATISAAAGITLMGGDIYFLPVEANDVQSGFYKVALDKEVEGKGLKIPNNELLLTPLSSRSTKFQTNLQVVFDAPPKQMVSIEAGTLIGGISPLEKKENQRIPVEFVNQISVVERNDPDKLFIYPARIDPSKERIAQISKAQKARENHWKREDLKAKSEWLEHLPTAFKEDALDVMQEFSGIMSRGMEDIKEGVKYFELRGKMPDNTFMVSHYKSPGVVMKSLYKKAQSVMIHNGLAEGTQRPIAIHPFSAVCKKNKKIPATEAEVDALTPNELWKTVRVIQDCSMLTPISKHNAQGYLPATIDNICKLDEKTQKSFFDMASAFNQLTLSSLLDKNGNCLRDFFAFVSQVPGFEYLRNLKLPMGFTNSMELCCFIFKTILDRCSAVPLHASLEEFVRAMKELDKNRIPAIAGKKYENMCLSFADDGAAQSPMENLEDYGLKKHSFYKNPRNIVEAVFYLHLQVLRKIFTNMKEHNLLIQPEKMSLFCGKDFEYLGFKFTTIRDTVQMMMPKNKLEALNAIKVPSNVRELQSFIGFCGYFSTILQNGKCLLEPLLRLIRKETPYKWGEVQQGCFDEIKKRLGQTMIGGFLKLANGRDLQEVVVFTDWCQSTKSVSATVYVKNFEDKSLEVALFWGKLLSSTFDQKPPFMCELAGVVCFLTSNKYLVAGKLLHISCDNIVAVGILKRRLQLVDSFDDGIVHRLLLSISGVPFRVTYVNSKCNAADFLSRFSPTHGSSYGEILEQSNCIKDMLFLDQESEDNSTSNIREYLKTSKDKAELVRKKESRGWNKRDLKDNYRSTHIFSPAHFEDVMAIMEGGEVEAEVSSDEVPTVGRSPGVEKDLQVWVEGRPMDIKFARPAETEFTSLECPQLFADEPEGDDDFFKTNNKEDLIRFITKEAQTNDFSQEYMNVLREDSHFIASEPQLSSTITNGMDGIIENDIFSSRLLLSTYLQEVNVIFKLLGVNNLESHENLFETWDELKEAAKKFKIAEGYGKRLSYLREVQNRSKAITLAKRIVSGLVDVDDDEVDCERRSDGLFRTLHNNIESLVVIDGLLFRAKFPVRGEPHKFCLVLENGDAERRLVSLHAKEHRGHIYLYTLFSKDFYTPGALRLAYDVTSRCPNCAQMKQRKRVKCSRPNLTASHLNSWAIDMKGPILVGSSKKYVLCGVETNLRLVHFAIANSLEATEIARLIFEGIIASYGSSIEIISDRGKSFLNKLNQALFTLGSIHHRLTDAYHPQSSISEGLAVRKFSSSMKALICGRNLSEWSSNVKYLQVLLNSSLIHPYLSQTPYQLLLNSKSTFYHPVLEMPEETIEYNDFWERRVRKFQELTKCLKVKYDTYLSMKANPRATVDSLGIEPGQNVWIRIFAFSERLAYLSSLLPRFKAAKVLKILGKTSLVLEDLETGKKITRHLTDCYPIKPVGNFSNLFLNSKAAVNQDVEEDFGGMPASNLPGVIRDGAGIEELKHEEAQASKDQPDDNTEEWRGRLRQRKEINYKE